MTTARGFSAAIAVVVAVSAGPARAQDCDLMCRFQAYVSTDHMAAPTGGDAAAAKPATKRPAHVAAARSRDKAAKTAAVEPKAPKTASVTTRAAKPVVKAEGPDDTVAATPVAPKPSDGTTPALRPAVRAVVKAEPPKRRAVAALVEPQASPAPVAKPTPTRAPRSSRAPHGARKTAAGPVASAILIPGSARLVPAEFQRFGDL